MARHDPPQCHAYSRRSLERLETCDERLQMVMKAALVAAPSDITIICGHRSKADQDKALAEGTSKARWPSSKHNAWPSQAVDIAPYPIDWDDRARFQALAEHVLAVADDLGVRLRWGGHFKTLVDMPHFELMEA